MSLRSIGLLAIAISTLIATILSNTVDITGYELGALFNLFLPGFLGLIAIIIYLLSDWLIKSKQVRITILVICCVYLLYVGLSFHFNKEYLPFPFN